MYTAPEARDHMSFGTEPLPLDLDVGVAGMSDLAKAAAQSVISYIRALFAVITSSARNVSITVALIGILTLLLDENGYSFNHWSAYEVEYMTWIPLILVASLTMLLTCLCYACCYGDDMFGVGTSIAGASGAFQRTFRMTSTEGTPIEPGVVGLANLGNTCYMNSTLQCLSHVPELTRYFVSGDYEAHLNTENPLGTQGAIANAYADLMRHLWSGNYISVAPTEFYSVFTKHNPRFANHEQQDNQEFLMALLDKLHEDLNQGSAVVQSPTNALYTMAARTEADLARSPMFSSMPHDKALMAGMPSIDAGRSSSTGAQANGAGAEAKLARDAWRSYVSKNRSIITDKFQGQQLCRTVCPSSNCGYVSKNYDAVICLPLPLPAIMRTWRVLVVNSIAATREALHTGAHTRAATAKPSVPLVLKVTIRLPSTCTVMDFINQLAKILKEHYANTQELLLPHPAASATVPADSTAVETGLPFDIWVAHLFNGTVTRFFSNRDSLRALRSSDVIAYMVPLPEPASIAWQSLQFYQKHRFWGREMGLFKHPKSSKGLLKTDHAQDPAFPPHQDYTEEYAHPVDVLQDCYDLSERAPTYEAREVIPAKSIPLVIRACQGSTLSQLRAVALWWAEQNWGNRSAAGVGVIGDGPPPEAPGPMSAYEPSLVWLDQYGYACGVCADYKCKGCPLPAMFTTALKTAGMSEIEATEMLQAAKNDFKHECWTTPLEDVSQLPAAIAVQWFRRDDHPLQKDHIRLNPALAKYQRLQKIRHAQLAAVHHAMATDPNALQVAAESKPWALVDPVAELPEFVMAHQVTGMLFHPPIHELDGELPSAAQQQTESAGNGVSATVATNGRSRAATDCDSDVTLETCLSLYTRESVLSEGNLYECPQCHERVAARQSTALTRAPEVMIIVLKRFVYLNAYGDTDKVDTIVRFPLEGLDFSPWIAEASTNEPPSNNIYDLFAVCQHSGTLTGGHYTAFAKSAASGTWHSFNDDFVRPALPVNEVLTPEEQRSRLERMLVGPHAYVLMYRRRDVKTASTPN